MNEQSASLSWISQNWIKILLFFAGAVFVIGFLKILSQLFNSNGPLPTGLGNLFGAAANLVNGIINGCTSQGDCTQPSSQDTCNKMSGCEWDPGTATSSKPACLNTSGRPPGGGNFFSGSCVLGMGSIFAICGALLFLVVGPALAYAFRKSNENIKAASETSGKSEGQIWKETVKETIKKFDRTVKEYEKDNPGKKLSESQQELIVQKIGTEESALRLKESVDSSSTLSNQAKGDAKSAADQVRTKMNQEAEEQARNKGLSEDEIKECDGLVPREPLIE
jgi:hypothetical protein